MTKIIIITSVFFLVMYMRNAVTMGSDVEQKRKVDDVKYSHLWFGPRVGRRKRNPSDDLIKSIDGSDIQNVLNYIKKNPWTIMLMSAGECDCSKTPKEGISDSIGDQIEVVPRFSPYVPRLGRAVTYYP